MAPDERSLLLSVAVAPEEDAPRLVYADWLDENATSDNARAARAEFIRTQISIARGIDVVTGIPLTSESRVALTIRENELRAEHRAEWEAETRRALGTSCEEVTFRRGFPCELWVNGVQELITSRILEASTSTLTELDVSHLGGRLPDLLTHPGIARLTRLNLVSNGIGDAGAEAVAASPHLVHLTGLELWNNNIGARGAIALAASPNLKNLTVLNLRNNNIGEAGAVAIATSSHLKKLTSLVLEDNDMVTGGAIALATSPNLQNLTVLNLWNNNIREEGAVAIATSPTLSPSAKIYALQSTGFNALAELVQRAAADRHNGRQ